MARVKITYFAILKDQAGKAAEEMTTAPELTAQELYQQLAERYQFSLKSSDVRVAINDEFAPKERVLKDLDHVVFIPPVAGG